ncbi:hypothetical protein P7C70_g648, partial [Phenoliferia sp. Uapishka_3]
MQVPHDAFRVFGAKSTQPNESSPAPETPCPSASKSRQPLDSNAMPAPAPYKSRPMSAFLLKPPAATPVDSHAQPQHASSEDSSAAMPPPSFFSSKPAAPASKQRPVTSARLNPRSTEKVMAAPTRDEYHRYPSPADDVESPQVQQQVETGHEHDDFSEPDHKMYTFDDDSSGSGGEGDELDDTLVLAGGGKIELHGSSSRLNSDDEGRHYQHDGGEEEEDEDDEVDYPQPGQNQKRFAEEDLTSETWRDRQYYDEDENQVEESASSSKRPRISSPSQEEEDWRQDHDQAQMTEESAEDYKAESNETHQWDRHLSQAGADASYSHQAPAPTYPPMTNLDPVRTDDSAFPQSQAQLQPQPRQYASSRVERANTDAQPNPWEGCTFEEWKVGGDALAARFSNVMIRVVRLVEDKIARQAEMKEEMDKHKEAMANREKDLDKTGDNVLGWVDKLVGKKK